jgi:hypothetical protein
MSESPNAHSEKEKEKEQEDKVLSGGVTEDPGPAVRTAAVTYEKRAISYEEVKQLAADFDIVILAAGAGMLLAVCPSVCVSVCPSHLMIALTSWI